MASERTPRPGGINLPGMRNSALATAALTSVALLSQTASATPATADDGPSREEVKQRVDNLYDRAETDSGTYNATRAASPRKRAGSAADMGGRVNRGGDEAPRRQADAAVGDVARQWFDVGRAKLGPTVPAALPTDRRPTPSPQARPARPASAPAVREATATGRPVPELTAGSRLALPAAPDAGSDVQQDAPRALAAAPGTAPSSLQATKQRVQRQLADASALLTARAAQATQTVPQNASLPAIESRPTGTTWAAPAEEIRPAADPLWQQQQPTALTMGTPLTTSTPLTMDTTPATGIPLTTAPSLTTNTPLTNASFTMSAPLATDASFAVGAPVATAPPTAAPAATDALAATQAPYAATAAFSTNAQRQADVAPAAGLPLAAAPVGVAPTSDTAAADAKAHRASAFARAQVGKPCLWGAAGPGSYDAAGLIQAAWKAADVELPRSAPAQAASGTAVSVADTRVGDLVFFYDDFSHVGLYIGNGAMIHAPGPGTYIREESVFYAGESAVRGVVRPA